MQGALALPAMAADALAAPVNMIRPGTFAPTAETIGRGLTALGLPEAQTGGERIAGRVVQEGAGLLTGGGLGRALQGGGTLAQRVGDMLLAAPGSQVAGAAGAGLAGGAAQEAGGGAGAQLAAGLLGGVTGGLAPGAVRAGAGLVGGALQPFSDAGRGRLVGEALLRQSADPQTLGVRLQAGMEDPLRRLEGAPFTTAQAARDPGLAALESGARNMPADPAGGIGGFNPKVTFGDMDARRDVVRLDQVGQRLPPAGGPEVSGMDVRGALRRQDAERRQAVSAAYEAVDPDGTARLPTAPILDAFESANGQFYNAGTNGAPTDFRRLHDVVTAMGESGSYQHLQGTRMELSSLIDRANVAGDKRLLAAAGRVREAIDRAAATAAEPYLPRTQSVTMADLDGIEASMGAAARPDVAAAVNAPAIEGPAGKSLVQWLVENGGLRDDGGDLRTILGTHRARPGLLNRNGMAPDIAALRAREAGYFPDFQRGARADQVDDLMPSHLYEAVDAEMRGLGARRADGAGLAGRGVGANDLQHEVAREMDGRGLGAADPAAQLRGVRYDVEMPAAGPRPVEGEALPTGMTPEQAERWAQAQQLRRDLGRDFSRDETGAAGVGRVLAGGEASPVLQDRSVVATLLRSPDEVRQALRAAGSDAGRVRQALRDEWFRGLREAMEGTAQRFDAEGNAGRTVQQGAVTRFFDSHMPVARDILSREDLAFVQRFRADLGETAATAGSASARGSNTVQNLALANVLGRIGVAPTQRASVAAQSALAAGGALAGATLGGPLGVLGGMIAGGAAGGAAPLAMRAIYGGPERAMREQLARALAEPGEAQRLIGSVGPSGSARAARTPEDAARARQVLLARMLMMGGNAAAQSNQ